MKCKKCGKRKAKGIPCRFCHRDRAAKDVHSLEGCLRHRFRCMSSRIKEKGWPPRDFTREQFLEKFLQDPEYFRTHAAWVASGYKKRTSPSVDRRDPRIPYFLENLQILPWSENHSKGATTDRELGTVNPALWSPEPESVLQEYTPAPDEIIPDWL